MQYMFPLPTRLSIANCISISSAVFAQLTAESPYILQCALKCDWRFAALVNSERRCFCAVVLTLILYCALQNCDVGESGEYVHYNDWIVIDNSKQNFVAKPFHVNEVGMYSQRLSADVTWQ